MTATRTRGGRRARPLYERGRARATRMARDAVPAVLLHGDLTPSNILDGGPERGLVAIDPAACVGDAAFDAVDLIMWRAEDQVTVTARAGALAAETGADPERTVAWCVAFAAMNALELACRGCTGGPAWGRCSSWRRGPDARVGCDG